MVNRTTASHPPAELLSAFGLGKLSGPEAASVESHVATCPDCCRLLGNLPDDPLAGLLRASVETRLPVGQTLAPLLAGQVPPPVADSLADLPPELQNHPRYQITGVLGRGGMGVVYRATHRLMERPVAIKLIRRSILHHPQAEERFLREVKNAARLQQENIVAAYDAEQAGGWHFLVMEYIEGITLDRFVARHGPFSPDEACRLIGQAAAGLQYAHTQGMVHRDIKPANMILTSQGQLKILDFGLARFASAASLADTPSSGEITSTALGVVFGSPDYMSPEQTRDSRQADIRSDLYSLGASLYFLLTGHPPFPGGDSIAKVHAQRETPPPDILQSRRDVPVPLAAILTRLLAKDPAQRFQTPAELMSALAAVPHGKTTQNMTGSKSAILAPLAHLPNLSRRTWLLTGGVAMAAAAGLTTIISLSRRFQGTQGLSNGDRKSAGNLSTPAVVGGRDGNVLSLLFVIPKEQIWTPDVVPVMERLRNRGGVEIITASWETGECVPVPQAKGRYRPVTADVVVSRSLIHSRNFAGILFAGYNVEPFTTGYLAQEVKALLDDFRAKRKLIAAICVGQAVLAHHGLLSGKRAAYGPLHKDAVPDGKAIWQRDRLVVVDNSDGYPLITSPSDAGDMQFADAILQSLSTMSEGPKSTS